MNWPAIIWLGLMVVFLIIEGACPIHLVSIWFAAASLVAMLVALLGGELWLQGVVFVVVSAGLLALLWPVVKKFINPKVTATNVDSLIGKLAHVTEDIDNIDAHGQAKVNGLEWSARSVDGNPIPKGTLVRIDHVEGVKLIVKPASKEA